ncbi:MAG: CarD-like/TRCF domain protein [Lachnospiraceae bacterium]|nr:CarD-like/TRCF domain protein [Lachnospiraceae bacterium]
MDNTQNTYEKKEIVYSSTMGICIVSDVTKLSADKNTPPVPYYVLKSYYDKTHVAYIPVEHHEVELRRLMDEDTAKEAFEELKKAYAADEDHVPDELKIGELAYIMKVKPEELKVMAGAKQDTEEI